MNSASDAAVQFLASMPYATPSAQDWASRVAAAIEVLALEWGVRIAGVVVVLAIAWILAGWARRSVVAVVARALHDQTLAGFLGNVVRWAVLVLGVVACLSIFGINIAAVTAVIGAAGLAVGLAMQGSLSNLAAGLMLLILRPFKLGDGITVGGSSGKVVDIDLFMTKIDTVDNRRLILPNSSVFGATIENATHHERRRVEAIVRTPFGGDLDKARSALQAAVASVHERLPEEPTGVALTDIGNTAFTWSVTLWSRGSDMPAAKDALVAAIKARLDGAGIDIARGI
ncbi:MAG: mechanosensitive ion channel [Phycisphaerae bacterium]|nr:mechanosensitive ion channel [Phycisphaerae bacterium]